MSASKPCIRVLTADDHPVVRSGVRSCLSGHKRIRLVGEAADGEEALRKVRELLPDVVIMDTSLPKMSGLALAGLVRQKCRHTKVLVLSAREDKGHILRALQAGAHGYLSKTAPLDQLPLAIESVFQGKSFFSQEIARAALSELVSSIGTGHHSKLTEREREVLVLIAEGHSNKEIAQKLGVGVRTVESHRDRIMRRLNIHTVAGLTRYAIANGIVPLDHGFSV